MDQRQQEIILDSGGFVRILSYVHMKMQLDISIEPASRFAHVTWIDIPIELH